MWILALLSITLLTCIRKNKLLRTYFYDSLYCIGLQLGHNIYTPVCNVYSDYCYLDIVLLKKYGGELHGCRIFHQEYFCLPLQYVPVGYTLVYELDGKPEEHLYFEGTPFKVNEGTLVLYKKKRQRLGFISEEVARSDQWPFPENEC